MSRQASWASLVDEEAVSARRVLGLWAAEALRTSAGAFAVRDSQSQSEAYGPKVRREPGAAAYSGVCVGGRGAAGKGLEEEGAIGTLSLNVDFGLAVSVL